MSPSDRLLARRVVGARTRAAVVDVAPILGRGEVNQVHAVTTGDGARFVVRSHERAELDRYRKEAWAIGRAGAAGVPVAPVLATGAGGDRAWMLQPFVLGTPGDDLAPDGREDLWRGIGGHLRRIHGVPVGGFGETLEDVGAGGEAGWRAHLAHNIGELTAADPLLGLGLLDRGAQARLRAVFERLGTRPLRLGLCHGDLSPKNVIVGDRSVQVIDWGCARGHFVPHHDLGVVLADSLGEGAPEFAALLEGCGIDQAAFRRDVLPDVLALGALEAVDKVRWALDRKPARLPALAGRLDAALRALGILRQPAPDAPPGT